MGRESGAELGRERGSDGDRTGLARVREEWEGRREYGVVAEGESRARLGCCCGSDQLPLNIAEGAGELRPRGRRQGSIAWLSARLRMHGGHGDPGPWQGRAATGGRITRVSQSIASSSWRNAHEARDLADEPQQRKTGSTETVLRDQAHPSERQAAPEPQPRPSPSEFRPSPAPVRIPHPILGPFAIPLRELRSHSRCPPAPAPVPDTHPMEPRSDARSDCLGKRRRARRSWCRARAVAGSRPRPRPSSQQAPR